MTKKKTPLVEEVAAVIHEAVAKAGQDAAAAEAPLDHESAQQHAALFLIGNIMEASKRRFTELALPWRELREEEQSRVLAGLAEDVRVAVGDAVRAIASNERITFRAEVEKVEFKGATDVKAVLKMVTSAEAHSLADVAGVCDHIRKELAEVEESGGSLAEWIDVVILALDGAWRSGATPEQIVSELVAKQTKNEGRRWPDWRTADTGKAIEHDRTEEAS